MTARPGTWVFKPRDQWHTFWNAGDTPCEIIEIISPAGFEDFFRDLAKVWASGEPDGPLASCARARARHGPDERAGSLRALRRHPPAQRGVTARG